MRFSYKLLIPLFIVNTVSATEINPSLIKLDECKRILIFIVLENVNLIPRSFYVCIAGHDQRGGQTV